MRIDDITKEFIRNDYKVTMVDPEDEYEKLSKMLGAEGKIIKIDSSKKGHFNPLELATNSDDEIALMDKKENDIREIIESCGKSQDIYYAQLILEMANKQKDSLPEEWYSRIVTLCEEYLNK